MTQPRLRVVLDTSAIVAYLQASIHVGETIAEVVDDWRALASAARMVGRIDLGVALLAAVDHDAYVLTGEPGPYGALVDDGPVIPI